MKCSKKELQNLHLYSVQGGSWSQIYSAKFQNKEVIVKAQKKGSRKKTDPNNDKFTQELKFLQLNLHGVVDLLGEGEDFDGERFLVLEKISPLGKLTYSGMVEAARVLLITSRQLFLQGCNWVATKKHVGVSREGKIKIFDLNDENYLSRNFVHRDKAFNVYRLIKDLCKSNSQDYSLVISEANKFLIQEEYLSLQNAHDPIYFEPYTKFLRTESEPSDKNFQKQVSANRRCLDREKFILQAISNISKGSTVLDIGCNTGWFCFMLEQNGFKPTGVDFDLPGNYRPEGWPKSCGGKIEFNRLLGELHSFSSNFEFADVTKEYAENMKEYDIILALSILHLYFSQHKVSSKYWKDMVQAICRKVKKVFIFETSSNILPHLSINTFQELGQLVKDLGKFESFSIIGVSSDAKRPLICCRR